RGRARRGSERRERRRRRRLVRAGGSSGGGRRAVTRDAPPAPAGRGAGRAGLRHRSTVPRCGFRRRPRRAHRAPLARSRARARRVGAAPPSRAGSRCHRSRLSPRCRRAPRRVTAPLHWAVGDATRIQWTRYRSAGTEVGTPDPERWAPLGFPAPPPDRPWIFGVVVASANGVVAWRRRDARDDPVREILGGEPRLDRIADRRLMRYLRTIGDAGIGAQTVREQPTLILSPQEPGDERAAARRDVPDDDGGGGGPRGPRGRADDVRLRGGGRHPGGGGAAGARRRLHVQALAVRRRPALTLSPRGGGGRARGSDGSARWSTSRARAAARRAPSAR